MEEPAEGVYRVEDAYTNWYLIDDGAGDMTVVDSGVPRSWDSFRAALGQLGRRDDAVKALVLTHAHFDHLGFAERARSELDIPVWVHEDDVPLTRHPMQYAHERSRSRYLLSKPKALPIILALVRNRAFWPAPVQEVRRFADGAKLDVPGSPLAVHSPGHTLGHCGLHLEERGVLLAGDALVMLDPYTGRSGPRLVARAATADVERALGSLARLAATEASTVLTGHGEPWHHGIGPAVEAASKAGAE